MIVDSKNNIGPWETSKAFFNGKEIDHCIFADDENGLAIRELCEVVSIPNEQGKRHRIITEYCIGPVRIELT